MEQTSQIANTTFSQKINAFLESRPVIMQILKYGAIGIINTALDFLILNFTSKAFNITSGLRLGELNMIGFAAAVVQSYFWNRYWTFGGEQAVSLWKNFVRLVLVGALGTLAMLLVILGAKVSAPISFYSIILVAFLMAEVVLWLGFGFFKISIDLKKSEFIYFVIISAVGLLINSAILAIITHYAPLSENADLSKNLAKVLATGVSLIWNFTGYKILVFKK